MYTFITAEKIKSHKIKTLANNSNNHLNEIKEQSVVQGAANMNKNKFTEKLKKGVSVHEIEHFTRKHLTEVFTVAALVIGAISSCWDFFIGPKLTLLFFTLGAVLGIFFPVFVEKVIHKLYVRQETTTQLVFGAVKIVIAIFIPFVLFGVFGLLAGTAYHYYTRHAQIMDANKSSRKPRDTSGDEHD